jgi:putative ABC transport system substrate-binding protein
MMDRRTFVGSVAAAAIGFPAFARAQKAELPTIGFLSLAAAADWAPRVAAFQRGLAEAGYTDGRNVRVEFRWAEGNYDRLQALAADLVQRRVAVIVATGGGPPLLAAKSSTSTIPIVFTLGNDPVKLGAVTSLNRPGANITGISILGLELAPKRVGVLHEIVPKATSIGLLVNPANERLAEPEAKSALDAARNLGLRLTTLRARNEQEIRQAFANLARDGIEALVVGTDAAYEFRRGQIIALAQQYSLPTIYPQRESVTAGGLASYGTSLSEAYRQAGIYAGKILGGARPAELPVLQLSTVELVINLKTAKALGLAIPQSILLRADELIQ